MTLQARRVIGKMSPTELATAAKEQELEFVEDSREDVTPEEAETRAQKKARLAQVLARGMVNSRLEVKDADPKMHYEWIRETDQDIDRHLALGFQIEFEKGKGMHDTGDNRRRVGDVILVSIPNEDYEIIREVRRDQKAKKSTLGKKEYLRRARAVPGVPVLDPLGVSDQLED